jgi:hypothetical protein
MGRFLVVLERWQVIDLLRDRQAVTVTVWLRQHADPHETRASSEQMASRAPRHRNNRTHDERFHGNPNNGTATR